MVPDITRPALSDERVQLNAAGHVEHKLKPPWRDGTTHLVASPLEFMRRLAALVTRPCPITSASQFQPLKSNYHAPNHPTCSAATDRQPPVERRRLPGDAALLEFGV